MSERMLDLLLRQWPGKTHLSAEETAKVLMQHPYTVRERMRNGELPGAEKRDGIWKMPLPDLAEHIEPTPKAPQISPPPVIVGAAPALAVVGHAAGGHRRGAAAGDRAAGNGVPPAGIAQRPRLTSA